jgi:hypothetical protein
VEASIADSTHRMDAQQQLVRRINLAGGVLIVLAGLGIAALDLGVIGPRIPAIRALPQGRQWADHVAYGLAVGVALRLRRRAARAA